MIRPDELTCAEAARLIHSFSFGRLGEDDAPPVRGHLSRCAPCRSIVEEIDRDTAEVLEATGLAELPPELIDLILIAAAASEPPVGEW